jgi:general stress protein 26
MAHVLTDAEKREKLHDVLDGFETAMLVTRTPEGVLRSRPLSIARKRGDDRLYFSTAIDTGKVAELEDDPHVNLALQSRTRFASVSGRARLSRDRALIDELWSEGWKIWFPQGKDDPSLAIVIVEPEEATYWDAGGAAGLRYLFESAKAYLKGERPPSDDDERRTAHVKVSTRS